MRPSACEFLSVRISGFTGMVAIEDDLLLATGIVIDLVSCSRKTLRPSPGRWLACSDTPHKAKKRALEEISGDLLEAEFWPASIHR